VGRYTDPVSSLVTSTVQIKKISGLAHIFHSAFITPKTKYWCALAQDGEGNEYVPYTDYSSVQAIADENGTLVTR
jgi:hypothetical protein